MLCGTVLHIGMVITWHLPGRETEHDQALLQCLSESIIKPCNVQVLTFESVDEILKFDHSDESY